MNIHEELHNAMEAGMREQMGLDDSWVYRDIPWITADLYQELVDKIGKDNMRTVSGSRMQRKNSEGIFEDSVRASVMINQQGMENIRESNA